MYALFCVARTGSVCVGFKHDIYLQKSVGRNDTGLHLGVASPFTLVDRDVRIASPLQSSQFVKLLLDDMYLRRKCFASFVLFRVDPPDCGERNRNQGPFQADGHAENFSQTGWDQDLEGIIYPHILRYSYLLSYVYTYQRKSDFFLL